MKNCGACKYFSLYVDIEDDEPRLGHCDFPVTLLPLCLTKESLALAEASSPREDWEKCPVWEAN
ncbi:MAG: hypothetical protein KGI54_16135 [Pseudomonadota bacterium]|nr:hypothetical protein [Pseudomonadota bacterium]